MGIPPKYFNWAKRMGVGTDKAYLPYPNYKKRAAPCDTMAVYGNRGA